MLQLLLLILFCRILLLHWFIPWGFILRLLSSHSIHSPEVGLFLPPDSIYILPTPRPIILKDFFSDLQTRLCSCLQDMSTLNMSKHKCTIIIPPKLLLLHCPLCPHHPPVTHMGSPSHPPLLRAHLISILPKHNLQGPLWFGTFYVSPASSPSTFHLEFEPQPLWITCSSSNTLCSLSFSKSLFQLLLLYRIS